MPGAGPRRRREERGGTGPSWLRLGCVLAVGQLAILALLMLRPAAGSSATPTLDRVVSAAPNQTTRPTSPMTPTTTTTAPVPPPTTVPPPAPPPTTLPPVPTTTTPPAPAVPRATALRGIVPPAEPSANIAPQPDFLQSCAATRYDDSAGCVGATLQAIARARNVEGLPAMALPSNWTQLSPPQQIFVATNLERTVRGLPPLSAMASVPDHAAQQGANEGTDPSPPGGFPYSEWGSNWAGAVGNPLEAMYFWMYDDGVGSANMDCTASHPSGCWGHRQNVLLALSCRVCVMGTGWASGGFQGNPSLSELLVESSGTPADDFTWQQETPYLP
jgi:hypothetical protein